MTNEQVWLHGEEQARVQLDDGRQSWSVILDDQYWIVFTDREENLLNPNDPAQCSGPVEE